MVAMMLLERSGVLVRAWRGDSAHLQRFGARTLHYRIVDAGRTADHAVITTALRILPERLPLFIVDTATPLLQATARTGDVAFVALRDRTSCIGRRPWAEHRIEVKRANYILCALVRLLTATSIPQRQSGPLADTLQVTQSYISALIRKLPTGTVIATPDGWVVAHFDQLWDWHARNYPGPGGDRRGWHSERARATQQRDVRSVVGRAAELDGGKEHFNTPLTTGADAIPEPLHAASPHASAMLGHQTALDLHGPVTVFSEHMSAALVELNYRPCPPADASVQIVQPADPTVWATAAAWGDATRTDPLVTAWELDRAPGNPGTIEALRIWARNYAQQH